MEVELHNVRARVVSATDDEHAWLTEFLSWPDDKAWVMRSRGIRVPEYTRLYTRVDDTYPAGFTRMLVEAAKKAGHAIKVIDARTRPQTAHLPLPSYLRPYQVDAVTATTKRTRGVIWAATGSGKTQVAMGLVESIPARWLFLVNLTQLGLQARDRYRQFGGMEAGVVAEGKWTPDLSPHGLTVATFQTLHARFRRGGDPADRLEAEKFLASIEGVIVDEAHVLPADSFRGVIDRMPNAYWRIGLSATPLLRGDRKSMHLVGCLGSVTYRIGAKILVEAGVLAKPNIRMVKHDEISDKKTWQGAYSELVCRSKSRNELVCRLAREAVKPCVVFVRSCDHGKLITKALTKAGVKTEYLDGGASTPERQAAVIRLERGDTDVIVATVIMNQGIDIPNLRSMVMAAGGASSIEALQRVGRGMRVVNGKTEVDVYDVYDTGNKWTERHSRARKRSYKIEEYDVEIVDPGA